jgi:hypothetical protein
MPRLSKEKQVLKELRRKSFAPSVPIGSGLHLPNYSGVKDYIGRDIKYIPKITIHDPAEGTSQVKTSFNGSSIYFDFGTITEQDQYMRMGAYSSKNWIDSKGRNFVFTMDTPGDIFEIDATTGDVDFQGNDIITTGDIIVEDLTVNSDFFTSTQGVTIDGTGQFAVNIKGTVTTGLHFGGTRFSFRESNISHFWFEYNGANTGDFKLGDATNYLKLDSSIGTLKLESGRRIYANLTAGNGDTTPAVANGEVIVLSNTAPTTITNFDLGRNFQKIIILATNGNTTITDGTNIFLNGSVNWNMGTTDTLTLIKYTDGNWYEIARSNN